MASICIVVDLTKPAQAYESVDFWIKHCKQAANTSLKTLQNKDQAKFKKINQRAMDYWREVPATQETNRMQRSLVPLTVIANKADEFFRNCEPI